MIVQVEERQIFRQNIMEHIHQHDHDGAHSHSHYNINNKTKFIVVICFNLAITVAEYAGGIISGSLALISDAWHNLSDVLALLLGYAGEKVSESNSSKKYSFGLKRFEVLIALINALSLVAVGVYIFYEAVTRFINPVPVDPTVMIPVASIALIGNVFSIMVISRSKDSNLNMKAAFLHLLFDAISSVAVIAAGIVMYVFNFIWIDLAISVMIVVMIIWSSKEILKKSFRIFLQGTPFGIDADEVKSNIQKIAGVGSLHGLHIWSINSSEVFLSCHICVNQSVENLDTDNVIKQINSMLENKYGITHTTIQTEIAAICSNKPGECCR
jgi:cobalt-zinc-cadmium efflux system protein